MAKPKKPTYRELERALETSRVLCDMLRSQETQLKQQLRLQEEALKKRYDTEKLVVDTVRAFAQIEEAAARRVQYLGMSIAAIRGQSPY